MEEYKTILDNTSTEIIEKKSKFIANVFHIENVNDAEEKIKDIKKKYYDARHNCVAYRVIEDTNVIEKSSDDGEPSGTAGVPILNVLQKNNIYNVLVIVTRYFGGILLGTGGLVRAYSDVTQKVIKKSTIVEKVEGVEIEVTLEYPELENFKYYCKKTKIEIKDIQYFENIKIKIEMEKKVKNIFEEDMENKTLKIKKYQLVEGKYINKIVK